MFIYDSLVEAICEISNKEIEKTLSPSAHTNQSKWIINDIYCNIDDIYFFA